MTTRRFYANAAPQLTLSSSLNGTATTATVSGGFTGYPTQFPFFGAFDYGTASVEIVSVTNIVGSVATIVRAQDGTAAISHAAGATFDFVVVARDYDEANAHTVATTGVHGVAGAVVGTSDVQTLTNKTLTNPALTNPTLTNPTVTGGSASAVAESNSTHTGDATHAALSGKATTSGGKTLSLLNSSGVEKVAVDDAGNLGLTAGNITTTGAIFGGISTMTGAATAATVTATGQTQGATLHSTGATTVGTTLGVTGNTTVGGTLGVTGAATVGSLSVGGSPAVLGPAGPVKVQINTTNGTFSGTNATIGSVTFSPAYASAPMVFLQVVEGSNLDVDVNVSAVSATGFNWRAYSTTHGTITGTITINWLAIG